MLAVLSKSHQRDFPRVRVRTEVSDMGAPDLGLSVPHYAMYSDETNWNTGRYRAVATVSMPVALTHTVGPTVEEELGKEFTEAKWNRLASADRSKCALEAITHVLNAAVAGDARIDVVIWDTWDSRHDVHGRSDELNLGRMVYRVYHDAMKRWPFGEWTIMPDSQDNADWKELHEVLRNSGRGSAELPRLFYDGVNRGKYTIRDLRERSASDAPFIQIADLLAGAAAYSRQEFAKYEVWKRTVAGQGTLFEEVDGPSLSTRDRARWPFIDGLASRCRERKLQVSLSSTGGLRSNNPARPVNFWLYEPQGDYDSAPLRGDE